MVTLKVTEILTYILLSVLFITKPKLTSRIKSLRLRKMHYTAFFFIAAFMILLTLRILFSTSEFLYAEDGLLEYSTVIFALAAFFILLRNIRRSKDPGQRTALWIMSFVILFFAMEEISWGQRLFGWETPTILGELNYQNETNLHNILNPVFPLLYSAASFLFGWLLISGRSWAIMLNRQGLKNKLRHMFPKNESIIFGGCFLMLSFTNFIFNNHELLEELLAVFGFSYSLRFSNSPCVNKGPLKGPRYLLFQKELQ
jgi:hypothetical protein